MRVSAKADYAVRAAVELAAAREGDPPRPVKGDHVAKAQAIPIKFLENILLDLRQGGLVNSRRGPDGGYWLSKPPEEITVADVIRAADGPLASVRGEKPEDLRYEGSAAAAGHRVDRAALEPARGAGAGHAGRPGRRQLPAHVKKRSQDADAWQRR